MPKLLTEPFIQKRVISYLSEVKGFNKPVKPTGLREHGVDIKMKHKNCGWYFLVECKGDPSDNVKSPEGSRNSCMNSALGQIITRMHRNGIRGYKYGYKYGIAFPVSFKKMILRKMPFDVMDKLNLYLFFVNGIGNVEEIDWKKLRDIKKK